MFWHSKKRPSPPPAEQEEQFIEWLLRYGNDFEIYRKIYKSNIDKYVSLNIAAVMKELREHNDKNRLNDRLGKMSSFYVENFTPALEESGGLLFLNTMNQAAVAGVEIKITIFHYLLKYKYRDKITILSESVCGPLEDIYQS